MACANRRGPAGRRARSAAMSAAIATTDLRRMDQRTIAHPGHDRQLRPRADAVAIAVAGLPGQRTTVAPPSPSSSTRPTTASPSQATTQQRAVRRPCRGPGRSAGRPRSRSPRTPGTSSRIGDAEPRATRLGVHGVEAEAPGLRAAVGRRPDADHGARRRPSGPPRRPASPSARTCASPSASGQSPSTRRPLPASQVRPSSARPTAPSHHAARLPPGATVGSHAVLAELVLVGAGAGAGRRKVRGVPSTTRLTRRSLPSQPAKIEPVVRGHGAGERLGGVPDVDVGARGAVGRAGGEREARAVGVVGGDAAHDDDVLAIWIASPPRGGRHGDRGVGSGVGSGVGLGRGRRLGRRRRARGAGRVASWRTGDLGRCRGGASDVADDGGRVRGPAARRASSDGAVGGGRGRGGVASARCSGRRRPSRRARRVGRRAGRRPGTGTT